MCKGTKKKANNKLQVAIFEFLVWKFLKFLNITIGYERRKQSNIIRGVEQGKLCRQATDGYASCCKRRIFLANLDFMMRMCTFANELNQTKK